VSTDAAYVERAIETGTTENGVFGAKLMWGYLDDVLAKLRVIRDVRGDRALMEAFFPNPRFIWIRREDVGRVGGVMVEGDQNRCLVRRRPQAAERRAGL
jgi:LPS sulfotransferase NodH